MFVEKFLRILLKENGFYKRWLPQNISNWITEKFTFLRTQNLSACFRNFTFLLNAQFYSEYLFTFLLCKLFQWRAHNLAHYFVQHFGRSIVLWSRFFHVNKHTFPLSNYYCVVGCIPHSTPKTTKNQMNNSSTQNSGNVNFLMHHH